MAVAAELLTVSQEKDVSVTAVVPPITEPATSAPLVDSSPKVELEIKV